MLSGYTQYLRWGIITGVFLIPFVSFIVATGGLVPVMFFPFITGKNFAFRILVEIILALYVLLALREPKYRPRSSFIMWAMLAFVMWVGISVIFSVDPVKSFWSNFERMEGYVTLLHLFAYFIVVGAVLTAERLWERFFQVSVGVSALQGLYALFQISGFIAISSQSVTRADTTFGNATYLAVYLLFHIFFTLFLLLRDLPAGRQGKHSRWLQVFYCSALVLQFLGLLFTATRGAVLGLVGGLILAALYIVWRAKGPEWRTLRRISWGALGTIALLLLVFFAARDTTLVTKNHVLSRLASISLQDRTTQSRFLIWNMAYQGFLERPIVGWGQESFNFVFNKYYNPAMYDQEEWFDRAHNEFLDWLIAAGLPAFLLFLSFFFLSAWAIVRSDTLKPPEQAIFLGLLAAYAFNSIFVFDNLISATYFMTVLAFVHGFSRRELPAWMFLSKPLGDRALAVAAPIVAVTLVVIVYQCNVPGIARAQLLIEALSPTSADLTKNIAAYEKALAIGPLGKQETVEQLLQFASAVASSNAVAPEVKQKVYELAHNAGEEMLVQRAGDARLELIFSSYLVAYGQSGEALQHLQKALNDSPKKQSLLFQAGLILLQNKEVIQGLTLLKRAFDLEPNYDNARIYYASGLYYIGQKVQADALLTERFGSTTVDNPQLLQIYTDTKQFDRVIAIWQLRVKNTPDDPQVHAGLATAYFANHDNANAIAELQEVAKLNAALAPQVQSIITQIKNGTLKPPQ